MPMAICTQCGHLVHWRNKKGSSRPAACTIPQCGGDMAPATYADGKYVPVASRRGNGQGRTKVPCSLCGRKRMAPSDNVRYLRDGFQITEYNRRFYGEEAVAKIAPDQPLCWTHVERVPQPLSSPAKETDPCST